MAPLGGKNKKIFQNRATGNLGGHHVSSPQHPPPPPIYLKKTFTRGTSYIINWKYKINLSRTLTCCCLRIRFCVSPEQVGSVLLTLPVKLAVCHNSLRQLLWPLFTLLTMIHNRRQTTTPGTTCPTLSHKCVAKKSWRVVRRDLRLIVLNREDLKV